MLRSESRRQVVMTMRDKTDTATVESRGSKGFMLSEMRALGLRVPPFIVLTTVLARAMMQESRLPKRLSSQLARGVHTIEQESGRIFGGPQKPLLLSVRSGAAVSMPGMMDTILNLGMNNTTRAALAAEYGDAFAADTHARFVRMYTETVGEVASGDVWEQLFAAISAVFNSWNSPRAVQYRAAQGIPEDLGTAVTVQKMVFGNLNERSATGVVFSCDPNTGAEGLFGEFLPVAQGEDVVAGKMTPRPIHELRVWEPALFAELERGVMRLERYHHAPADIEFTIEDGVLYFLQSRKAKLTPQAKATFAVHRQWAKIWTREQAVAFVTKADAEVLASQATASQVESQEDPIAIGIAASPGAFCGAMVTDSQEAVTCKARGEHVVLFRRETNPDDMPGMLAADAFVTECGGATSHAAVVARQLGKPAVVGIGSFKKDARLLNSPKVLTVCGTSGRVFCGSHPITTPQSPKEVNIFRRWLFGNMPEPCINFDAVNHRYGVYDIAADVYVSDAMVREVQGTRLAFEARKVRDAVMVRTAEMFVCYLVTAVAGELRHGWAAEGRLPPPVKKALETDFGYTRVGGFTRGEGSLLPMLQQRGKAAQVEFFTLAAKAFRDGWWGLETHASLGGRRWADIAEAGKFFLDGTWKHGVFVDRVFDLRHNSGRLFDKHPMVSTQEGAVCEILNIKRTFTGVETLRNEFRAYRSPNYSSDVLSIWEKGLQLKLWKEESENERLTRTRTWRW